MDSSLITFGGYGNFKYKSVVNKFNKSKGLQQIDFSNRVSPRYLSAAGKGDDSHWLIFGGYGSTTGRQELSPEFFYDLCSYDLKKNSIRKICTYKEPEFPFVPCESLIKDKDSNSFYTLVYNSTKFKTHLHLAKFGMDKPNYEFLADSITL